MQPRPEDAKYEVQAWEKIKTPKGEFDAFKIVMTMSVPKREAWGAGEVRTRTYYYAPNTKAIVSFYAVGSELSIASTLIDFGLAK